MDIDYIASIVWSLSARPSRRAVMRGLAALTASAFLAPFTELTAAKGKGGKGGKGKRRKGKRKLQVCQEANGPVCRCGPEQGVCPDGTCCPVGTACGGVCGCCPAGGQPGCCAGPLNHMCYDFSQEQCCYPEPGAILVGACPKPLVCMGTIDGVPWCCESGSTWCDGEGCCPAGSYCCGDGDVCCNNETCQPPPAGDCFPRDSGQPARIA
jgi:hypothetical protein